jgi:hypothetical protein
VSSDTSSDITSYQWLVTDCKSRGVNKGCASDISAVVFLYIVNDNLHKGIAANIADLSPFEALTDEFSGQGRSFLASWLHLTLPCVRTDQGNTARSTAKRCKCNISYRGVGECMETRTILCRISGFHSRDYEECRVQGCGAVCILQTDVSEESVVIFSLE